MNAMSALYAGKSQGFISVVCISPKTKRIVAQQFFPVTDLVAAEEFSKAHAMRNHVYHSFNVLGAVPESGRGTAEDFTGSVGVFLDVDIRQGDTSIHSADTRLPADLGEVMALIESSRLPRPTSIVDSGNGYYFQYKFPEPMLYPAEHQRLRFEAASRGFHEAFAEAWRSKGWKLDPMWDLPRITRMPGTWNHKTKPPKFVKLIENHLERFLSHAEFLEFADKAASNPAIVVPVLHRSPGAFKQEAKDPAKADFRPVHAACRALQYLVETARHLTYNEWFALAGILKHCRDGEQIFIEISAMDPRYNADEAAKTFANATGPTSCRYFSTEVAPEKCAECPFAGNRHVGTPIAFGDISEAQAQLMSRFVYATLREKFFNRLLKKSALDAVMRT